MASTRRMLINFVLLSAFGAASASGAHAADALQTLGDFLSSAKTGQASFTQTVRTPAWSGQVERRRTSQGVFSFQRPTRFRFEYQKPFAQTIVADGQTLWLYDPDLAQVTARGQGSALSQTPAAVLVTAQHLADLQKAYALRALDPQEDLVWVQATPKQEGSGLQWVRVALRSGAAGVQLAQLHILDAQGNQTELVFRDPQTNPVLPAQTFVFTPPKGVDVIRQPG
jgi:outer membrane lipoprotein carrier protein